MKLKVIFSNQLPFMIQLPSEDYKVKVKYGSNNEEEYEIVLTLSDEMYRLHLDNQPGNGSYIDGLASELNEYIRENEVRTYAFTPLKSFITCTTEKDIKITDAMVKGINEDEIKDETIKIYLMFEGIKNKKPIYDDELDAKATNIYKELSEEKKNELRNEVIIRREINKIKGTISLYHIALNIFIKQYRNIRNDFFVEPLTVHTLEGTWIDTYIDNVLYDRYKHAEKAPSFITHRRWMPEILTNDLQELKDRLFTSYIINPSKELIITARNLLERGEYRSAIIEANAALEIAVAEKIKEKMKANGDSIEVIDAYLSRTETSFYRRCDSQLKEKTSYSFVTDNSILWSVILSHKKNFRNKIAHTALIPPSSEVSGIISDYEIAIQWVESI